MRLTGRVLILYEDPELIKRQLAGENIPYTGQPLAFGVNTDQMISGGACTLGYTGDILGPHFLENFLGVVTENAVRNGGFQVVVGGDAYGTGSSREVAVVAHQGAGIELVIALGLERIFRENMVYSGMPFTTDFAVLDRLLAGEDVDLGELASVLPPFFAEVTRSGGLLPYGPKWFRGDVDPWYQTGRACHPMTIVEKIIASRAWSGCKTFGLGAVRPGEQLLCKAAFRGLHEYTAGMCMALFRDAFGNSRPHAPSTIACFEDHFVLIDSPTTPDAVKKARLDPARQLTAEMVVACKEYGIPLHGPGRDREPGVCHRLVVEKYAKPGDIVVLTDSHTPTAGVLNCLAFGIGSTAMTFALYTGLVPVTVPKTIRVIMKGNPGGVLTPKDIILHLIGDPYFREKRWASNPSDTCCIQFGGPGLDYFDVDELSVLTNMTVEGGLMTGIVEPCESLSDFLREYRGDDMASRMVFPDDSAEYERSIEVDLAHVPITIALPGDSRNRALLSDHTDVSINNVVIGSCTGASLADLRSAYKVLKGRTIKPGVRVTVSPSSTDVAAHAEEAGILQLFRSLGVVVTEPGCGACIGNGPGVPLPGEVTASTTNRNFDRRMGSDGPVYLVSPAVAAASAVTGHLADPRDL